MKHACLRARVDLPAGADPTDAAAASLHPHDAPTNPDKVAVALPSTPELPEDKRENGSTTKLLGSTKSADVSGKVASSQSTALKHAAGVEMPVKTSASRLSVPLVGAGHGSGKMSSKGKSSMFKKLSYYLRCCFAAPANTDDTEALLKKSS